MMAPLRRVLAALLAAGLCLQPAAAQVKSVRLVPARVGAPALTVPLSPGQGLASPVPLAPPAPGLAGLTLPLSAAPAPLPAAMPSAAAAVPEASAAPETEERAQAEASRLFDGGEAVVAPDPLAAERPQVPESQIIRVRKNEAALLSAVRQAIDETLPKQGALVVSRGSTARLTFSDESPDYDLLVSLPPTWTAAQVDDFFRGRLSAFQAALSRAASAQASRLFPGHPVRVLTRDPVELTDPATGKAAPGVLMLSLKVLSAKGNVLIDADVTLTNRPDYANPYPEHFSEQLRRAEQAGGPTAAEGLLSDIRLAKRLFKEAVKAYKPFHGGPGGVGTEQMVLQSGGFDRMMERVRAAAVDEQGRPRSLEQARRLWTVANPYMKPGNFLELFSDSTWSRLAYAAERYLKARAERRPLRLADLRRPKQSPPPSPTAGQARPSRLLRVMVSSELSRKGLKKALSRLRHNLQQGGGGIRDMQVFGSDEGRRRVDIQLRADVDGADVLERIRRFFAQRDGSARVALLSELPKRPAPRPQRDPPAEPTAGTDTDGLGTLTLDMLEKFTLTGPRPAERGPAFLYAQGARPLPQDLESAWPARPEARGQEAEGLRAARALLQRRGERTYVLVPGDEAGSMRSVKVPAALARGVVSNTLVEVEYDENGARSLRPVGAYPMDMVVGRVVQAQGRLVLENLFRTAEAGFSPYAPLPLPGGIASNEGRIVQASVRPSRDGFEAVPLVDLGDRITPEVAAAEMALRNGARGYMEASVIRQAEEIGRTQDPPAEFARLKARLETLGRGRAEDLRGLPFVTIDPIGAGDLDDAFYVEKRPDGGFTWYLATADVSQHVPPGSPAFRAAARVGNTFYSIDKDGVGEYPMNHPVVSKYVASLLAGKDSMAMITRMSFSADGTFLPEQSEVFLGLVRVQGRYTYDQVAELWRGRPEHGVAHVEQVALARELAGKLDRRDGQRGKLKISLQETEAVKDGPTWSLRAAVEDPLLKESHRLIEELKVYGNRVIALRLMEISKRAGAPHISRVHPPQEEAINERLRKELETLGAPWREGSLGDYLERLQARTDLSAEAKDAAQRLVLTSRRSAGYAAEDGQGHEGLALEAGSYDHPSAPIRRFSDMYNRALLEADLEGGDPKAVHAATLADLEAMGFSSFEEYLQHLNGREQAARQMDREMDLFMSVYELSKPEYRGRTLPGYVMMLRQGREPLAVVALRGSAATLALRGEAARGLRLLDAVEVTVRGADLAALRVDAVVRKAAAARP